MNFIKKVMRLNWSEAWPLIKQGHKQSKRSYLDLFKDMYRCYKQGFNWGEYFIFGFQFEKSEEYRKTFVCNNVHYKKINDAFPVSDASKNEFDDKGLFNRNFKDLKGIETLDLRVDDYPAFEAFVKAQKEFFVKHPMGCGGHEVHFVRENEYEIANLQAFHQDLLAKEFYVVEERIVQHPEVSKLSLHAVNTIRIVTARDSEGVLKAPFIASRIAIGDSYMDNCSIGGASSPLDKDGVVQYPYFSNIPIIRYFDKNQYTGFPFVGFKFPYFQEAIALCLKAAERCSAHYIGWDVAISENGPVLVEANRAPSFDLFQARGQLENKQGRLAELEEALKIKLR